ncbi:GNAT family N-acetyltransferase [Paraglaciecola sp.]|uniref:GNAT family N-acetyltransferase n=1 Tax=Paraglaciecola sp. TaxID=1920173 RepID=UPI0030F45F98
MHVNEANITNLIALWKIYGSRPISGSTLPLVYANATWPYRCWASWNEEEITAGIPKQSDDFAWLNKVPNTAILPVWQLTKVNEHVFAAQYEPLLIEQQLLDNNWRCTFEQLAMYMDLRVSSSYLPQSRSGFTVTYAHSFDEIKTWVEIGSEAFGYAIDRSVIENLLDDENIQLLLGWQEDRAVCCALLYKTGDIIGVHQVGVKHAFQGQGIARCFMQHIIESCALWQGKYIVLQASQSGQPLYESLGFKAQFKIKNYQKV